MIPFRNAAPIGVAPLDASSELRRELANAVLSIAREMAAAPDDGAALAALNENGPLDAMRAALKMAAARLVRDKFAGLPGASDAPGPEGARDSFTASFLDHMLGHLNAVLNATAVEARVLVGEMDSMVESMLVTNTVTTTTPPPIAATAEPPLARLRRIADEAEFCGAFSRAARIHSTRVALAEAAAAAGATKGAYDASVWVDMGLFFCRRGSTEWPRAVTCLREALSCDAASPRAALALAALLLARGEVADAEAFAGAAARTLVARAAADAKTNHRRDGARACAAVSEAANALPLALTFTALAAGAAGADARAAAALLDAVRALAAVYTSLGAGAGDVARCATPGSCYLITARAALDAGFHALARRVLSLAVAALIDTDAPRVQRADVAALRARRFALAMCASLPRARVDYADVEATARAVGEVARVLSKKSGEGGGEGKRGGGGDDVDYGKKDSRDGLMVRGGVAYDGAITSADEAERTVHEALALSELCGEAWDVSAQLWGAGMLGTRRRERICGTDLPLPRGGAPELGDVDAADLVETARRLRLAISTHAPPLHGATCAAALDGVAPALLSLPPQFPVPAASAPFAPAPSSTPTRADAALASSSGVGGGLIFAPCSYLQRLYLRLAATQLQLAAADANEGKAAQALAGARDSYARAAAAGRAEEAAAPNQNVACGPWASSWLGLGRALWAQGDAADAEAAFGEANSLDNGHPATWAWLAHLCSSTGSGRDREAAAALNEALKAVSKGSPSARHDVGALREAWQ